MLFKERGQFLVSIYFIPAHQEEECGWFAAALMHKDVCRNTEGRGLQPSITKLGNDEWLKSWVANDYCYRA